MLKQVTFVDIFSQQKMRTLRDYLHCELDLSVSIPYKIWIAIANFFIQNNVPSVVEGAECCQKDSWSSHYLLVFSYRDKDANRVVVDCINFINVLRDLKVHDVICTKHYVYLYVRHSSAHHNVHAILPFLHHVLQSYVNDKTTTLPLDYTFDPLEEQESFFDVIPVTYHGTYEVTTSLPALVAKIKPKEDGQYVSDRLYCEKHWMCLHNLVVSRLVDCFYYITIQKLQILKDVTKSNTTSTNDYGIYKVSYYKK